MIVSKTSTKQIRWQILMIAIIGSLGFSCYLLFSFVVANQNEKRIEDIRLVKFPIIEYTRRLESSAHTIRENLTNAIGLEDPFLIDDARALAVEFEYQLKEIELLDIAVANETNDIRNTFQRYFDGAEQLALSLIDNPDDLYRHGDKAEAINRTFVTLNRQLKKFLDKNIEQYSRSLFLADHSMKQANRWGVILGFITIAVLIGLALTISVRVVNAIMRSDQLKEQFLATISHELRTPMNGIMGAITLLKGSPLNDGQKKLLEAANTSSSDMLVAVNDILEFSDILSGDFNVQDNKWTLQSLMTELLTIYSKECDKRNLIFKHQIAQDDTTFLGDENRISHVLRHLLNNAVKFTPVGTVCISVTVEPMGSKTKQIAFTITDTGPGVPEQFLADIFNPFQQVDGSFSRRHGGLGIGLAICKRIADAMRGTLTFNNRDEGGAVASFSLPAKISAEPLHLPEPVDVTRDTTKPPKSGELISLMFEEPLTILVAEDNKVNQMVIKGYLNKLGCEVITANHGREALNLLETNEVDLILMDCQMPVMDGFEATRRIRELKGSKATTPIIAVTANAMDADRERCLTVGMNNYIKKPVEIGKLRRMIDEQMNQQKKKAVS